MTHYHAYSYTGRGYADSEVRKGLAPNGYPPLVVIPRTGTPDTRLTTLDDALAWLEQELTAHPPVDSAAFPVTARLVYSRERLQQTRANEVIYGYWSQARRYISRRLYPCDRPGC